MVDNGSTDDTQDRIAPFRDRLILISQPNRGRGGARNAGASAASGEYIAFLDADDLWLEDKLLVQVAVSSRFPASGLIACDGVQFEEDVVRRPHILSGPLADRLIASGEHAVCGRFHNEFIGHNPIARSGRH